MSEAVMKLRPFVDSLTDSERDELMGYMIQRQRETLNAMLERRREELVSGTVTGIPADDYFAQRKAQRT